jgi:DNA-directed RNA polymerase subunit L
MDIKVIEDKKNKLIFEIDASHTFCNALKVELANDSHVKNVGYNIKHPLVSKPAFIVETDGADPRKTLTAASQRVKKLCEKAEAGL